MKTKKLIAILTIVALMMTLVPMAAFGAPIGAQATTVVTDKNSVAAGGEITFTLVAREATGNVISNDTVNFWIKSSSDSAQLVAAAGYAITGDSAGMTSASGEGITAAVDANGLVKFKIKSNVAGTATITLYNKVASDTSKLVIGEAKTLTFTADAASATGVSIGAKSYGSDLAPGATSQVGFDLVLNATVKDAKGNGIAGQTVTFKKKVNGGNAETIGTATTDAIGVATLSASQTKAANYDFLAESNGKTSADFRIVMKPGSPYAIEAASATKYGEVGTIRVGFIIKDAFGNILNGTNWQGVSDATKLTAVVYTSPEGSSLKGLAGAFNPVNATTPNAAVEVGAGLELGQIIFKLPADKAGTYTIIGSITGTGLTSMCTVNVGKFGTIQKITLVPGQPALKVGESTTSTLFKVDENGIRKPDKTDVVFSSSNVSLITVDSGTGAMTATSTPTARGVATITALHTPTGLTASVDIPVAGEPADMVVTPTVTDKVAKVSMQLVDAQGGKTYYITNNTTNFSVIAPAGVTITDVVPFKEGKPTLGVAGTGSFTATSTEAGQKTFTVITALGLSKTFTVSFATPASDIPGAANINMYIGAKGFFADGEEVSCDVAPFIGEGNRTFVELRNLANAMGVANEDITYENGVITLKRADMTLVLTIGSNTIQKTVDGVTTTVTADVAPYIVAGAGRTVLPLRAVGEAFGYTVNYNPANQLITIGR